MRVAALDLGTNTFLCLIVEGDKKGIQKVLKDLATVVRLGQDIDKTGVLHPDALVRARECLTAFKKEIDFYKVDKILAMATSAARDAKNGDELFKIGADLGIPIEIIPGEDEARITYQGATVGLQCPEKRSLIVDVGGGSTELIVGQGKNILFSDSLNIGGVRLTEKVINAQPVSSEDRNKLMSYIEDELSTVLPEILILHPERILAVAGTPTSLVAIEVGGFDEKKVDGYFLSKERLQHWVEEFAQTSILEKKEKYQLGGRADIIFVGASILLMVIEKLKMPGMFVSTKGVRYGVALEVLQKNS